VIQRPLAGPASGRVLPFLNTLSALSGAAAGLGGGVLLPSTICRYSITEGHSASSVQYKSNACPTNKLRISSMKMSRQAGLDSFRSSATASTCWKVAELIVCAAPKTTWVAGLPRRSCDPSCRSSSLDGTRNKSTRLALLPWQEHAPLRLSTHMTELLWIVLITFRIMPVDSGETSNQISMLSITMSLMPFDGSEVI
jgi:hypothetical protein